MEEDIVQEVVPYPQCCKTYLGNKNIKALTGFCINVQHRAEVTLRSRGGFI